MEMLTTEWLPRSDSPVREAKTGIFSVSPAYQGIKMEWLWSERPLTDPGQRMNTSNDWCSNPISIKWCKNDKRNSDLFFNNNPYKNEKRNSNPLSKVMRKRKTKFISVFQSDEKTKNEIFIRFSKWWEHEKQKAKIQICFSMSCENEKRKMEMEFEFHFPMPSKNGWH